MLLRSSRISSIHAREVLDSRGNPTVACRVTLASGASAEAQVPSGRSVGRYEALELRDGGKRYGGQGVLKAVKHANRDIANVLRRADAARQQDIDHVMMELDGTPNKATLGANAILAVSLATARAMSVHRRVPLWRSLRETFAFVRAASLPTPTLNVLNGGAHANWSMDVQECMIVPRQRTMSERIRAGTETFQVLRKLLTEEGHAVTVGDEGGFAPKLKRVEHAFQLLMRAIRKAGYRPGTDIALATDIAASELYDRRTKTYQWKTEGKSYTAAELLHRYRLWQDMFPLVSIEDPFAEDDWDAWKRAVPLLKQKCGLIGDDLFVTNTTRVERGIRERAATGVLIKFNQIGTLSETVDAIVMAQRAKFAVSVSHRSGETADTFIADLAVASGAEYLKSGAPCRSERVEKYNRLMAIEGELG
jgi:enolase